MDVYRTEVQHEGNDGHIILCLMSDLHFLAADHAADLLESDLEAAKELGARISINGDMFDAITPTDKRYHNRVSDTHTDDVFDAAVEHAVERLKPYADLLEVISPGNHERTVLKKYHTDLISRVIHGLNGYRSEGLRKIHQGSYRGYQQYVFGYKTGRARHNFSLFRHHGAGGDAPATGGALDLDRIRKDFQADMYWVGHKHKDIGRGFNRVELTSHGKLRGRDQRAEMSAGYKQPISQAAHTDDYADFSEGFYQLTQTGAVWVLVETRKKVQYNTNGFNHGLRWSVSHSPYQLMRGIV